jgi:hypothetical protein
MRASSSSADMVHKALLRGNSASRELELSLNVEEGRGFTSRGMRDVPRTDDADDEEDELEA